MIKQLTQKLKSGKMTILEVPLPTVGNKQVLVKNHYSLISAGTEASTVRAARRSLIGKAKERPQQVRQVIDTLKAQGIIQTYRAIMKKLDAYSPLGYSCVGEVIDLGKDIDRFNIGDFVACGGLTASHSEVVCVPPSLCVKISSNTDLKQAAYNSLGAIAMQGVRQVDLRLGETCGIIGLGLLGQLCALLLRASGIRVVGVDIDQFMVDIAVKNCVDLALHRDQPGIEDRILQFSDGFGCDGVIITAATKSLDPINFAGAIVRKRGTIVVLGAVPTGFDREPYFYKKELQIKMSCSYGPGRYDPNYEEKGLDYPIAYARWTENRNMQAFQDLIAHKKIDLTYLTTHIFKLEEAPAAYDMMMERSEPFIGILIEYEREKAIDHRPVFINPNGRRRAKVNIGFIGAGSYAQSFLLPNIPKDNKDISLKGIMTATSSSSRSVAERYGFTFCTGSEEDILGDKDINAIFIATRHNSHAEFVLKALKAGKNVFVEKPLCLYERELHELAEAYAAQSSRENTPLLIMVGYNRRFSPLTQMIKDRFINTPLAMIYRINAGSISSDSWIQDTEVGGGRIIGEICHFIDFLTFINGSLPVSVYAKAMKDPNNLNDTLNISLSFQNGSIGSILYFSNGDKSLPKEHIEIYANGSTAVIDDFRSLTIYANGKKCKKRLAVQDKGQKEEMKQFIEALLKGGGPLIPFEEILSASLSTFKIRESIHSGDCLKV